MAPFEWACTMEELGTWIRERVAERRVGVWRAQPQVMVHSGLGDDEIVMVIVRPVSRLVPYEQSRFESRLFVCLLDRRAPRDMLAVDDRGAVVGWTDEGYDERIGVLEIPKPEGSVRALDYISERGTGIASGHGVEHYVTACTTFTREDGSLNHVEKRYHGREMWDDSATMHGVAKAVEFYFVRLTVPEVASMKLKLKSLMEAEAQAEARQMATEFSRGEWVFRDEQLKEMMAKIAESFKPTAEALAKIMEGIAPAMKAIQESMKQASTDAARAELERHLKHAPITGMGKMLPSYNRPHFKPDIKRPPGGAYPRQRGRNR